MTLEQARKQLEAENQAHVLRHWERLDAATRTALLEQIAALDLAGIGRMRAQLTDQGRGTAPTPIEPLPAPVVRLDDDLYRRARARGEQALRAGEVAVLLVAGGQGSRLGFEGPKGAYPIGPVSDAVLFYFHARKVLALSRSSGRPVPFYIMTSGSNDAATRACFAAHGWFGLDPADVFFFKQGMWPAMDADGRLILDAPGHLFMSPDGHGGTLSALRASGGLDDMRRRGIRTVFYFQVDNPLVEVADPAFVGLHLLRGVDLSIKVCAKRDPQEGLGVVVQRGGRSEIVEYTELTEEQKNRRGADGELVFRYGSVAIHLFQFDFLARMAEVALPLHVAHKKIPVCADDGTVATPAAPNGYKFEKFIFDVLPYANEVLNLMFDRREEFSPVKNAAGADSPDSCRRDLAAKWARWLAAAGVDVARDGEGFPAVPIEIDPAYARTPEELSERLDGAGSLDTGRPIHLKLS